MLNYPLCYAKGVRLAHAFWFFLSKVLKYGDNIVPKGLAMNMLLEASVVFVVLCFHLSCMYSVNFKFSLHCEERRRCGDSRK